MKLTHHLHFGGPGSGCNPEVGKCGRPSKSGGEVQLFHGTAPEFVESIKDKGLVAGGTGAVYVSDNKWKAMRYALTRSVYSGQGILALVVLKPNALDMVSPGYGPLNMSKVSTGFKTEDGKGITPEYISHIELYKRSDLPKEFLKYSTYNGTPEAKPFKTIQISAAGGKQLFVAVVITGKAKK